MILLSFFAEDDGMKFSCFFSLLEKELELILLLNTDMMIDVSLLDLIALCFKFYYFAFKLLKVC